MALEAVQAQAGHRFIESTRIYLHLASGWLEEECRRARSMRWISRHRDVTGRSRPVTPSGSPNQPEPVCPGEPPPRRRLHRQPLNGLIAPRPGTNTYVLTPDGQCVAIFYTRSTTAYSDHCSPRTVRLHPPTYALMHWRRGCWAPRHRLIHKSSIGISRDVESLACGLLEEQGNQQTEVARRSSRGIHRLGQVLWSKGSSALKLGVLSKNPTYGVDRAPQPAIHNLRVGRFLLHPFGSLIGVMGDLILASTHDS